jgi:branched-chain amino acid transport system ATP-binding protein
MSLLELEDVQASYDGVPALHGMELHVAEGEMVALLGANGAGKTTTLRAISGTVSVVGLVRFDGRDITGGPAHRAARLGVGHVPEGRGTFVDLTVEENLTLGALARGRRLRERVKDDLDAVHDMFPVLRDFSGRPAGTLSGGQQQMLAIARAILGRPRLLLVDEPSLGLAPMVTTEILQSLRVLQGEWQLAILLAEQNARRALAVADRAYVLESGRVVASGTASDLREDTAVQDAYLGVEQTGRPA